MRNLSWRIGMSGGRLCALMGTGHTKGQPVANFRIVDGGEDDMLIVGGITRERVLEGGQREGNEVGQLVRRMKGQKCR